MDTDTSDYRDSGRPDKLMIHSQSKHVTIVTIGNRPSKNSTVTIEVCDEWGNVIDSMEIPLRYIRDVASQLKLMVAALDSTY